jgi:hypothetical protein
MRSTCVIGTPPTLAGWDSRDFPSSEPLLGAPKAMEWGLWQCGNRVVVNGEQVGGLRISTKGTWVGALDNVVLSRANSLSWTSV